MMTPGEVLGSPRTMRGGSAVGTVPALLDVMLRMAMIAAL